MQHYIGIKHVKAIPMTLGVYNKYRGWSMPSDEDPFRAGYLVEYPEDGSTNHPSHKGYISWSPADVFANAYTEVGVERVPSLLAKLKALLA
jgi:hypothetical protein